MNEFRRLLNRHPKGVTLYEIAAHLQLTPRSARRYLDELRLRLGLEAIEERPGGVKRWRIPAIDLPRKMAIRRTQAYSLLAARTLFDCMRGSTLYEEIDMASQSLLEIARRPGRGPNAGVADAGLEQRFRYVPFAPKDYSHQSEDLDNLFQAVANLQSLSCHYEADDGAHDRLVIDPYALLLYKDAIMCLAFDSGAGRVRALPLERLSKTQCLQAQFFELPADFALDDFIQGQFGIWPQGEAPYHVVVDFDPSVRAYVTTRTVHPSQRIEELENHHIRMHLSLSDLTEIGQWVLGFGHTAKVIEPAKLVERIKKELKTALAAYRE